MAENENKTEKKTVEMSIWFIILLVVLIITTTIILALNAKLQSANARVAELEKDYNTLSTRYSTLCDTVLELSKNTYYKSAAEIKESLEKAVGAESSEVVSGDIVSGDVINPAEPAA